MDNAALEKLLEKTLEDFKLDQDERNMFRELSEELRDDQLRFIRNKSFEISKSYIEKGGENAIRTLNWLNRIVKTIQPLKKNTVFSSEACFSPGNDCRNKIISLINDAIKKIDICVFTISDNKITKSILLAHQRGVEVSIISDNDKANDKGSDINYLFEKGVAVVLDDSPYHMHHKFAIFDNKILLNGSFNWTRSATDYNEENIMISKEFGLVQQYNKKFISLKNSLDQS